MPKEPHDIINLGASQMPPQDISDFVNRCVLRAQSMSIEDKQKIHAVLEYALRGMQNKALYDTIDTLMELTTATSPLVSIDIGKNTGQINYLEAPNANYPQQLRRD